MPLHQRLHLMTQQKVKLTGHQTKENSVYVWVCAPGGGGAPVAR